MKLYSLLEDLLNLIEELLKENPSANELAELLHISAIHLQRLFKDAFGITLASYIRSRRLTASLDLLFNSEFGIIDIAVEYGFDHAQSYIRAFKSEFGFNPGQLRKSGTAVKVKPPLQLFPANDVADGILFGPEILYVPEFHCMGRNHVIPDHAHFTVPAQSGRDFWIEDKDIISADNPDSNVYIGLTKILSANDEHTIYTPSILVSSTLEVSDDYQKNTIPSGMYARFRYVGKGHPFDLNADVARGLYHAISVFQNNPNERYGIYHKTFKPKQQNGIYFEKIDQSSYDGTYCIMEWFSPVYEK